MRSKRGRKAVGIRKRHERRKDGRRARRREEQKTIDIRDKHEKEGDRHTRRREEQKTIDIRDGQEGGEKAVGIRAKQKGSKALRAFVKMLREAQKKAACGTVRLAASSTSTRHFGRQSPSEISSAKQSVG